MPSRLFLPVPKATGAMGDSLATTADRRTVLRGLGALAVGGALAGCSTETGNGGDGGGGGNGGGDGGTPTPSADATVSGGGVSTSKATEWAKASSNYDGVVDETGKNQVTVDVGAKGNNGNFAFAPPAVKVSKGTIVKWQWTGEGGTHNVVANSGEFDSGSAAADASETYTVRFEATGAWRYYCSPHKTLGMKGAVIVE